MFGYLLPGREQMKSSIIPNNEDSTKIKITAKLPSVGVTFDQVKKAISKVNPGEAIDVYTNGRLPNILIFCKDYQEEVVLNALDILDLSDIRRSEDTPMSEEVHEQQYLDSTVRPDKSEFYLPQWDTF